MKLKKYLDNNKITITDFAKKIGIHRNNLSRIINGNHFPSRTVAYKIEKLTSGEVTAESLLFKKYKSIICPHCGKEI